MRYYPSFPMVIPLCKAGYLRVTHPFATTYRSKSFHLHVLGMPPALILSQDQTLNKKFILLFLFCSVFKDLVNVRICTLP